MDASRRAVEEQTQELARLRAAELQLLEQQRQTEVELEVSTACRAEQCCSVLLRV